MGAVQPSGALPFVGVDAGEDIRGSIHAAELRDGGLLGPHVRDGERTGYMDGEERS